MTLSERLSEQLNYEITAELDRELLSALRVESLKRKLPKVEGVFKSGYGPTIKILDFHSSDEGLIPSTRSNPRKVQMAKSHYEEQESYKKESSVLYNWYGQPSTPRSVRTNLLVSVVVLVCVVIGFLTVIN